VPSPDVGPVATASTPVHVPPVDGSPGPLSVLDVEDLPHQASPLGGLEEGAGT
jgi:hypothetical protein